MTTSNLVSVVPAPTVRAPLDRAPYEMIVNGQRVTFIEHPYLSHLRDRPAILPRTFTDANGVMYVERTSPFSPAR